MIFKLLAKKNLKKEKSDLEQFWKEEFDKLAKKQLSLPVKLFTL